jgi:quinol monooxygenase YgiN
MLIISGKVYVDGNARDAIVDAFADLIARARAHPGCLDLVIAADPIEHDRLNNYERWESEEALAAWRKVAKAPKLKFDRKRSDVQKHQVSRSGPPF